MCFIANVIHIGHTTIRKLNYTNIFEVCVGGAVQQQHQRQVEQGGRHQVPKSLVQLRIREFVEKFPKVETFIEGTFIEGTLIV